MTIEQQIEKICLDLNIKFDKSNIQDWGIIHSDANRVEEFLSFYKNANLNEYMQYYVFELIVASYNDAMLKELTNQDLQNSFLDIVSKSSTNKKLDIINDYWRRICNEEEFPVGKLL